MADQQITLKIKPTSGGDMFTVNCSKEETVGDLKKAVSEASPQQPLPADVIRLIYKGGRLRGV